MKKLFLLLSLIFSLNSFSQIEKPITKGNMVIAGGASIQNNNLETSSDPTSSMVGFFSISLTPGFGYFIQDNLSIGLNTNMTYLHSGYISYFGLGVGPNIRYYYKNGLFIKAEFMIDFLHRNFPNYGLNGSISKQTNFSLIPGIGYALFLNQKVALEPCLSYMIQHTIDQSINSHNFLLELKFSIFL
jgi:hypothetical protein